MTDYLQDPSAILDYTKDWSAELALNGGATITDATVTADGGATVTKSFTDTVVTYRLTTAGVSVVPSYVNVVIHIVLSTGEEDERTDRVQVTNR